MAVPMSVHEARGAWRGASSLNRPWRAEGERVSESPSGLRVVTNAAHATIAYGWAVDGKRQEGTMVLGMDEETGAVEVGWADTWHQPSGVMLLSGDVSSAGAVRTRGSFKAGEETWGWTIDLALEDGALSLTMANVTPKGAAEWVVRAVYKRE